MQRSADDAVAAVLLAGGASTRFDHEVSKVYVPLRGRPLLSFSLETLELSDVVDHVVLVVRAGDSAATEAVLREVAPRKLRAVVEGGATRHESETAGLEAVQELPDTAWVMLHDAARPFVTLDLLDRLVGRARGDGTGVVPGRPFERAVVDEAGRVVDTSSLITVQTPQLFTLQDAVAAYRAAAADGFRGVDTAETVGAYRSTDIEFVDGDPLNFKITTLQDLLEAERLVAAWDRGRWAHDVTVSGDTTP